MTFLIKGKNTMNDRKTTNMLSLPSLDTRLLPSFDLCMFI